MILYHWRNLFTPTDTEYFATFHLWKGSVIAINIIKIGMRSPYK